jgi:glyoxylase-like metal-dependent hydrolase (beta-lactamase superfamily II)
MLPASPAVRKHAAGDVGRRVLSTSPQIHTRVSALETLRGYARSMSQVWTRSRAGTAPLPGRVLVRSPLPERPQIHLISLPLDWELESTQIYFVEDDPLTLIDTGVKSRSSLAALESALEELGYGVADIERVVLTHGHRDHFGLVETLRERGARLECWVHEADAPMVEDFDTVVRARLADVSELIREAGATDDVLERIEGDRVDALDQILAEGQATRVDRVLREGDRVEWKDFAVRVLHSPGHTPGHLLLEDDKAGLLVTGDQVMGQVVPRAETFYVSALPDPADPCRRRPRFKGLVELRRSLRRLRGRNDKWLLPGYGGLVRRAERTIRDTILYYDVRLQRIDRSLRHLAAMDQEVTAFDLRTALFPPDEPLEQIRAQILLLIGALDCLEEDGLVVTRRRSDGVLAHRHR